ncbi:MAG: NYN domain-containing protein [Thaumarchaeota archaeon]|nr:NYN domain-containing protein [Nitrososphaerota archaeon]
MDRCAIFIDGGYLSNLLKQKDKLKIDYEKLSEKLSDGMYHVGTYYYDAKPYSSKPETHVEKNLRYKRSQFFTRLDKIPRFEVKLGFTNKITAGGKDVFQQKGVDVKLALDLVKMCCDKQIQVAVIVTADGDFVPAVQAAKEAGVITKLCYSNEVPVSRYLLGVFDEKMQLTQDILDDCLLHPS